MPIQKIQPNASFVQIHRFLLISGIATAIVLVVAATWIALAHLHQQAEKKVVSTSQSLAKSLDLTLHGMITRQLSEGPPRAESITKILVEQARYIDFVAHLRATNEQGDVIYGPDLTKLINVSGRDFFNYFRDNPNSDLYIGTPLISVLNNKWTWIFARRINKPDGSFGGVIFAPIYVEEIEGIFTQMDVGPNGVIIIRNADYVLIHQKSHSEFYISKAANRLPADLEKVLEKGFWVDSYKNQTPYADGTTRIHTFSRNSKYGYTVVVGLSSESVFAEWRREAWIIGGLSALFLLATLACLLVIFRSSRNQNKAIASLRESERSLIEAHKIAQIGCFNYDLSEDRWTGSEILDDILGIDSQYVRDRQGWINRVAPQFRHGIEEFFDSLSEYPQAFDHKFQIIRANDGYERWVHGRGELQLDEQGKPTLLVGTLQALGENREQEESLHIANHDPITGLPNRRLLDDRLVQAIAHARRSNTHLAVCYLDLDEFKLIYDRFGDDVRDKLLLAITDRLRKILREEDTLARVGGDEFILLINDLMQVSEIRIVLDRVLAAINSDINVEGLSHFNLSASIGVAVFPDDNVDTDTLIRHAAYAMYHAKESGKNRYQLFDPEHNRQVLEHRNNLRRLGEALSNDEFVLYYQPKVDLQSGEVIGAEALIRWLHPEQGILPPGAFLHHIEGSKLEIEVGEWVINSALSQIEAWSELGLDISVSVNISAKHLLRHDFAERLRLSLERHSKVAPAKLELEILESAALSDMDHAVRVLTLCKESGVKVALDDFGTGYSSLTYFRKLPIDVLKIDRSFVRDMLENTIDLELIGNVLHLANVFKRPVIAEGVETMEHGAVLVHMGCPLVQGYGIAKPMPAAQMCDWVKEWGNKAPWLNMSKEPHLLRKPDTDTLATSV